MATLVEPDHRGSIPEHLSHLFQQPTDPVSIAGELARIVEDIEAVLTPILGVRGVAALYQRCVHLTRAQHKWLADAAEVAQPTIDLPALTSAFVSQAPAEANAAANALLHAFHDLLASLIGHALSARLLDPVWTRARGRLAEKDPSP
jgi:hypothetical protein